MEIPLKALLQLPREEFYVTVNGRKVEEWETLVEGDQFRVWLRLPGGKGGFGSLLRSFRIYKSTNQEMCRDLTGRRLKDAKEEERLKKWIAKKAEREAEKERKFKEKYERLKAGPGKHEFNDIGYQRQKEEILDKTDDAMDAGLKRAENKAGPSDLSVATSLEEMAGPSGSGLGKRKGGGEGEKEPVKKKAKSSAIKGLWMTEIAGLDEGDLASSDEENDESNQDEAEPGCESADKSPPVTTTMTAPEDSVITQPEVVKKGKAGVKIAKESEAKKDAAQTTTTEQKLLDSMKEPKAEKKKEKKPAAAAIDVSEYCEIDLEAVGSLEELEGMEMNHLKAELMRRKLKCGGTPAERAKRLWSVRGLKAEDYPKNLKAK